MEAGAVGQDGATGASSWCAANGAEEVFAEGVARAVPDGLTSVTNGGGSLHADSDSTSPPNSMAATVPALAAKGDSAAAFGSRDFPGASGTQFTLTAQIKIASSCFSASGQPDPASVLALLFPSSTATPSYELAIAVTPAAIVVVEIQPSPDGGLGNVQPLMTFDMPNLLDRWASWTLNVNGGLLSKTVGLTIDNKVIVPSNTKLQKAPLTLQHPTVFLGVSTRNDQGLSPGCKVNVDDILFDAKTPGVDGG
jgi:hypothetical protein